MNRPPRTGEEQRARERVLRELAQLSARATMRSEARLDERREREAAARRTAQMVSKVKAFRVALSARLVTDDPGGASDAATPSRRGDPGTPAPEARRSLTDWSTGEDARIRDELRDWYRRPGR